MQGTKEDSGRVFINNLHGILWDWQMPGKNKGWNQDRNWWIQSPVGRGKDRILKLLLLDPPQHFYAIKLY